MENTDVQVQQHPWDQEEDDNELEEGLVTRKNNLNKAIISTTLNGAKNAASVGVVTNGQDHQHEYKEEQVKDCIQENDLKVDQDEKEKDKENQHIPEFSVYHDTDKGIWKCRICSWDNKGRTCLTRHNQHPREHSHILANAITIYETKGIANHVSENNNLTNNNQENGNGTHSVISKQNGEHKKHEMSFEGEKSALPNINTKLETTDIEVVKDDDDDEITEYDVETVLKKQDTHDLYCPNCNSCITKRVILRKRKRRIPVIGEDAKRSKPQTPVSTEPNVVLDDSSDNQANVDDHQRDPDVFRCLSCFSIFMPTGNGFKLFRMFGNKSNEQNNEHPQKEVPVKKSWFSNFLRPEKVEHNGTHLNDSGAMQSLDAGNNVRDASSVSSNLNLSMQEANSHTSNSTLDLQKNQLQSDTVIRQSNGNMATDSTSADNQEQLLTSYLIDKESNSESEYPGMFVVKPLSTNNVEPAENPISPLQHDGLKLVIPPNVGSLIIDNSQMNQELDITVQTNSPGLDEKWGTNLSFSPTDSKLGQLTSGGQMNNGGLQINLSKNGKEQTMEKNSVSDVMPEISQHTFQNNVEIHLEEPLKVNKDVLTENQIDLLANAKNIENFKGKDTIITIESRQVDASVFQGPPGTPGATGSAALQQAVAQGGVTTATRGGRSLDVIKSIVYGGLIELIASLSVVSSAVGADATTLNVLALGLANIFGGLFVISHDLWDLKSERTRKTEDRYQQLLGHRADFPLHMAVSLLSFLIFGFLPPIVYGFSFRESNDKDLKLLMVGAASIVCIMILAAGRAYVQSVQRSYLKTISYHVVLGFMVSGASYFFGGLIIMLLEKLDVFHDGSIENLRVHGVSSESGLATF